MIDHPIDAQSPIQALQGINGVFTVPINVYRDERGRFMETFRREWFPWVNWDRIQSNRSDSQAGVLRGLHFHRKQVDYWYVMYGRIRVGLVDLRQSSSTYLAKDILELGDDNNMGVFVPSGVAHGFYALTDCTLTYIVNNYYDGGADEYGVAWNDPEIELAWGIKKPSLSERDARNPVMKDIPQDILPQ